jgi:2,4'-dihydroxyacetophenone dioxygenase
MTENPITATPHGAFLPARITVPTGLPWVPGGGGKSSLPVRFLRQGAGFVELLRLEPGARMSLHRHSGAVHAYNLQGRRQLCTGEVIEPGQYVYEPPGNTDHWHVVGEEPLTVMVTVFGNVSYLDDSGAVCAVVNAATQLAAYRAHCAAHGIAVQDICE